MRPLLGFWRITKPTGQTFNLQDHFAQLSESDQRSLINDMRENKIEGWQRPAGPFVYLVPRSDVVDVVYGTMDGYAHLGIPYMPHIAPTQKW